MICGCLRRAELAIPQIPARSGLWKMAAGVDLAWVSQVLSTIPAPTGTAQIAAVVCNLLSEVDIVRIAHNVGQIQQIA